MLTNLNAGEKQLPFELEKDMFLSIKCLTIRSMCFSSQSFTASYKYLSGFLILIAL